MALAFFFAPADEFCDFVPELALLETVTGVEELLLLIVCPVLLLLLLVLL